MELTTPGPVRPGAGIVLGKLSFAVVQHGRRRAVLLFPAQDIQTRTPTAIQPLTKSVEHGRPDLNRVRSAQILNREADLKRVL